MAPFAAVFGHMWPLWMEGRHATHANTERYTDFPDRYPACGRRAPCHLYNVWISEVLWAQNCDFRPLGRRLPPTRRRKSISFRNLQTRSLQKKIFEFLAEFSPGPQTRRIEQSLPVCLLSRACVWRRSATPIRANRSSFHAACASAGALCNRLEHLKIRIWDLFSA